MKLFFILLICIIFAEFINAFDVINEPRWINAQTGLRMRESPDLNAKVIVTIPYGNEVKLSEEQGEEIEISGTAGKWSKIKWMEKEGWVFGGFLSKENPKLSKISEKDFAGEWSYYFENTGKPIKYFSLKNHSIIFYDLTTLNNHWNLSGNSIFFVFYDKDEGEESIKIEWRILDFKPGYLKVHQTWSYQDTSYKILELYKDAKER
jgi:hypothetical protein